MLLALFSITIHSVIAQADFASEEEFKKQAAKLFDAEEFEKAYPLYSQLVSLYRKDPNYNYRLGVCMLFASDEKERAITFLEFATKSKDVEKEAFFYLAKAYHLNYRFDDAIREYQAYKKIASNAKAERLQVDRQIEMCKNGKKLLRNLSDLPVIGKTEMAREDFFRSYDISEIGGKLLVKPDEKEFRTSLDKKKNEKSILYLAQNSNQIYFSSYGDNEQHGKDIYKMKKLPSGEWGKPEALGNTINTAYDEDYPFLHPNGKVLYFCSKGHNSMGGYDIFKSTLDEKTNLWNEPVNMDFPINSPDDDILYITNADEKKAYFSSARSSIAGKVDVYHIDVERKPIDFVIIDGKAIKNKNDKTLDIKITVKNVNDNTILGIFNSKPETGIYNIKLPNGGRFLYTVETEGYATQSDIVEVPVEKEFRPLKQEISYEPASDKLIIKNLFDEPISDSNYLLAINVIKEKSKLDISPVTTLSNTETPLDETASATEKDTVQEAEVVKTNTKLSNDDIVKIAYQDANVADTEATDIREQADIALNFANQKNEQAQSKFQDAATLMETASKTDDIVKKQALTDEANAIKAEADQLNKETVVAFNLATKLDATASSKREEADLSQQYAKGLEAAVKTKDSKESFAKLDELEKKIDALNQINADRYPVLNSFKREEDNKKRELDKAVEASASMKQEIIDNETIITNLKTDADKTKKADLKQGLNNQIAELELENSNKQKELDQSEIKNSELQKEYASIKNETEMVNTVIDQSKTGSSETAAAQVASIDKVKLQQQVNSIKNQPDNTIASSKTNVSDNKISSDTTNTNNSSAHTVSNTTAKAFLDINKQYADNLKTAEKIDNETDREKEKAKVLKKWSEAIDDDVAKQKQDYISTTDPEMKALLAKKISDAENSSKDKQSLADQSLAKVESLNKQNNTIATSDNANLKDTSKTFVNDLGANDNSKKQFSYNDSTAGEQIAKADDLKKEADDLLAQSLVYHLETVDKTSKLTQKERKKQGDDLVKRSQAKRSEANELETTANKNEYDSNQHKIDQLAKTTASNTSPDLLKAEILSDESKKYFDMAKDQRKKADLISSNNAKEIALDSAKNNEMIALEKQKESFDIYNSYNPSVVASSVVKTNNIDSVQKNTNAAIIPNTTASIISVKTNTKNTNAAITPDTTASITPVKTNTKDNSTTIAKNIDTTNSNSNSNEENKTVLTKKELASHNTTEPIETTKANLLTKQADSLLTESDNLKSQALKQNNADSKKALVTQSDGLVKQAQEKKVQAAQLNAKVNTTEYNTNKNELDQFAKEYSKDNSDEISRADMLNDEALIYFDKAQKLRKHADTTNSYDDKEIAFNDANKNELLALEKQKKSTDIYKNYKPGDVTASVISNTTVDTIHHNPNNLVVSKTVIPSNKNSSKDTTASIAKVNEPLNTTTNKSGTEKEFTYKAPMAIEKKLKADSLNKQSDDLMAQSVDLKSSAVQQKNVDAKNSIYAQSEELAKEAQGKKMEASKLIASTNTTEYEANQNQLDQLAKASSTNNAAELLKAEITNDEAKKYFNDAKKQRKEAKLEDSNSAEETKLNDAQKNEMIALEKQQESMDIYKKYNPDFIASADNATANNNASEKILNTDTSSKLNSDTVKHTALALNSASHTTNNSTIVDPISSDIVFTPNEVFIEKSRPFYSLKNPIPINKKLPEGLIFKVQIGAFRKPIPQNLFQGMSPITGETTSQGFIRYTAGLFEKYATADKVKNKIIDLGYKDAFVVAFLNGKRIPINQAYAMEGGIPTTVLKIKDTIASTTKTIAVTNPESNQVQTDNDPTSIVKSQSVSAINGLFYTVQVGVFSKPVLASKLYSMKPLFSETAANGNLRYYTGIYKSVSRANEAKEMVNDIGIKDAFVTAYYNGKRISMAEAKKYETQGEGVFSTASNVNKLPVFTSVSKLKSPERITIVDITDKSQPIENNESTKQVNEIAKQNNTMIIDSGIVFKVQIGAFNDEVPIEIANKFLKIAKRGIKNYKDNSGLTIYTVGNLKTYDEANVLKNEVVAESLTDAFIVAYRNGEKIPVEEARNIK